MNATRIRAPRKNRQRGSSLFIMAAAMVVILGLAGIAVDLVFLYVGKSEAQRAADAAALAGATVFVSSTFTSGGATQATVQTLATNQAIVVGQKNLVGGTAPSIPAGNVTFDFSHAGDPMISVAVNATLPTFFMKIFGVTSANISAAATAEAYNAAGSATGPTYCASCLKPFLVPNCDPDHLVAAGGNPNCPKIGGQFQDYYLNPPNYGIKHPGAAPGGIVGESWQLHSGAAPSQWYSIAFLGAQSKSAWKANIQSCNTDGIVCGQILQTLDGKAVGPADQGINGLIHATRDGLGNGQDTIDASGKMFAGSNNPLVTAGVIANGAPMLQSDSLVTVPVYDGANTAGGTPLTPGKDSVKVVGYLQMFIQDVNHQGQNDLIDAIVINATSCGANTGGTCAGGGGTTTAGGAGFVPIRLVHP